MSIENGKLRINVTLPADIKQKLDKLAKKENRSTSNLVAMLIKNYVENESRK